MKPDWDTYFMGLAWFIKEKSPDPDTKHGSVIVSYDKRIISTGYNGHPTGVDLESKYFQRPDKYKCMIHAEHNAILNMKNKDDVEAIYITGRPCLNCLINIVQVGCETIIQLNRRGTILESSEDQELYKTIIKQSGLLIKTMSIDCLNRFNQVFSTEELRKIQTPT